MSRTIYWKDIGWWNTEKEAIESADALRGWSGYHIQAIFCHPIHGYAYVGLDSIEECQAIRECIMWRETGQDEWIKKG